MSQIVYAYDKDNGEYKGPVQAQESPLEPGVWLDDIPYTLTTVPPPPGNNETVVVDGKNWVVKPDYRGVWYSPDGFAHEITEIGKVPDPSWTEDPPELPTPPISVTPWQFRKALNQIGLRAQVEQAVAASDDQDLKDGWEFATEFVRTDPLVVSVGLALGKTEQDLDDLFALARTL